MYVKILVPLDGSELAESVLAHVSAIAKGCGARNVIFLRAVEPYYIPTGAYEGSIAPEELKKIDAQHEIEAAAYLKDVAGRAGLSGVSVKTEVIRGRAAEAIAEYATENKVDLIAIASHGRSGISRWVWGSVADRVLRSACVPVLIVRAPGCIPSF